MSEGVKKLGNDGIFVRSTNAAEHFSNTRDVRLFLENWLNIQRGSSLQRNRLR
jgi:hypothetical protein